VGTCALLLIALEAYSIHAVNRYSITDARVSRQYLEAERIRQMASGGATSVLMVGNSLLLYGVDLGKLREETAGTLQIHPLFLEGTGYYDWFYALRRLFRQGARPRVVVAGLEPNTSFQNSVWEQTPMLLFGTAEVLDVASDLRLDHTATTNLLLSHVSTFWEMRSFFRRRILLSIVPHFESLFPYVRSGSTGAPDPEFETMVISRLRTLNELCEANGARLVLLIPPTLSSARAAHQMVTAAERVGVQALLPIDPVDLTAGFYEADTVHLNAQGAVRFTTALARELPKILVSQTVASRN
jgi:hypothetical protein